jgi:hypothetical protein
MASRAITLEMYELGGIEMAVSQQDPVISPDVQSELQTTPITRARTNRRGNSLAWIGGAIVVVILIALGLTVPSSAPAHQLWMAITSRASTQAQSPTAAIQATIQRGNQEQAQGLSSGNPQVRSDTSTASYCRTLMQANQDLAAQGATSINLVQLTWGPITVNGTTATATTTETWTTTFSDGTTIESTDTNVYTLVQQGGTWLIDSDQQAPSSASTNSTPGSAQPTPQTPLSVVPVGDQSSHNWSGYVSTGGRYTGVSGTWTVPQPSIAGAAGVGATWVGVGGVSTHDLIQAGTQDVSNGSGQAEFQAWIEMLPGASQQVPLAVAPGDSVTVSILELNAGSGQWQITVTNNTTGENYQTNAQYASSESSAEWIEEAPASSNGILPLDNFSSVAFTSASAVKDDQTVDLSTAGVQPVAMLNASGQPLAVPSAIGSDGSSFTVSRTSASATTPTRSQSSGRAPQRQPGAGR